MDKKEKKALFKRPVVWVVIVILFVGIAAAMSGVSDDSVTVEGSEDTSTQESKEKKEETSKLSLQDTYDKLKSGMSKDEVEKIIGKDAGSCSETEAEYVGKIETCTYGSAMNNIFDGGMIMVQYHDDKLDTKSISKF